MQVERYEAIGQRGEACIIIGRQATLPNGEPAMGYYLASGERLVPGEEPGHFATLDGRRTFRLRHLPASTHDGAVDAPAPDDVTRHD